MRRFLPDYSGEGLTETYGPGWLEPYRDAWSQLNGAAALVERK
jgi:hypothetical protein